MTKDYLDINQLDASDFCIVNDADRPWDKLIAQRISATECRYVHPSVRGEYGPFPWNPNATLEKFGFVAYPARGNVLELALVRASAATYADGEEMRQWQGRGEFDVLPWLARK